MSEWIVLRGVRRARSGFAVRLREQMFSDFFSAIIWTPIEFFVAIARLRAPGAEFDRATSTVRIGRRSITLNEIVCARIDPYLLESGVLILRFGDPDGLELNAYLRAGIDSVSPRDSRELLAEILHSSSISPTRRGHTPMGSSDSISMTRNEAIALVLDVPPTDGDLPLTH
jgi:hypothetical protein